MMGGPKQNHVKVLAHADAIMRHCKKDGIAKCEVITGELKVLGDMGCETSKSGKTDTTEGR